MKDGSMGVSESIGKEHMNITYRKAGTEEYHNILDFFQRVSSSYDFTDDWFRWKYLENPMGPPYIYFAEDTDRQKLAGIYCVISWNLRVGNQQVSAVQSVDTMIDPAYRGHGIVRRLSDLMFRDLRETHIDLLFGFPNDEFFPITLKIGWKNPECMKTYVKMLSIEKIIGTRVKYLPAFCRSALDRFLNIPDLLRKASCKGLSLLEVGETSAYEDADNPFVREIRTHRSPDYLRWRYDHNPLRKYRKFALMRDGRSVCLVIGREANSELVIIDILAGSEAVILPALVLLGDRVRRQGLVALRSSCCGPMENLYRKLGFIVRKDKWPLITYSLSDDTATPWNADRNWHLMPGDIDVL